MELKFDIDPMIDSAIDNIKDAMGSWDMNSVSVVSVSSHTYGDVVVVSARVADGKVDAITSDCDVELAFELHTCESGEKNTRWLIYVDSVEVSIKHERRIIAYERFYIDETKKIADFIKKHIIFN